MAPTGTLTHYKYANLIGSPEEREPVLEESVNLAQGEPLDRRTLDGHHDERYVRIRRFLRSSRRRRLDGRSRCRHSRRRRSTSAAVGFLALNVVVVKVTVLVLLVVVMMVVMVVQLLLMTESRFRPVVRRFVLGLHYQQHRIHRAKPKKQSP